MSRAWYFVALVPLAIGLGLAGISFVRLLDDIRAMPRMVAPGEDTFTLDAGEHVVFGETESVVDGVAYRTERFSVRCAVTAEDGSAIPVERYGGRMQYAMGGFTGSALFTFELASDQTVRLACDNDEGNVAIAIGPGIGMALVVALLAFFLGLGSAIAVFAIVFVRRRRLLRTRAASHAEHHR